MSVNNSLNPFIYNYIYVNEDQISRSLICPICLDPLLEPRTHVLCENSFCNQCITKLNHCPFCRTSLIDSHDLKITNHHLLNLLNEIPVQCNICKQILSRGDFDSHIASNCLQWPQVISTEDRSHGNTYPLEKHLSNLYRRVHKLEDDIEGLKKVIYLFLFVLSTLVTIVSIGALFSSLAQSFFVVFCTIWLPMIVSIMSKLLFDFSPIIITCRLIFLTVGFTICSYKTDSSNIHVLTRIIYFIIILFNLVILLGYLLINYFNLVLFLGVMIWMIKYFYLQIPNNFVKQLQDQINIFFCHSFNQ